MFFRAAIYLLVAAVLPLQQAVAQEALTLDEAISLALTRNERAAIAMRELEAADARVMRARSFFFPEVNAVGNHTLRGGDRADADSTLGTLNVSQTLFDARAFPLYRSARLARESVRWSTTDDRRNLAFDAAEAFLTTLSQQKVVAAAERRRQFAAASLSDAEARVEAGLVSSNDVSRARLELASAELALARSRGLFEATRIELGNLLAIEPPAVLAEPVPLLEAAASVDTTNIGEIDAAVARRPDVIALRRNEASLREFAKEPSRRIIPTVGVNGQVRGIDEGDGMESDNAASVVVNWNIFDGGERRADRVEREAEAEIASLVVRAAERRVADDYRAAIVDVVTERDARAHAAAAAEAARRNAAETAELYRQGLASSLEVADANVRRFEAEVAESRALYELGLAYLNLRSVSGFDPFGKEMQ